MKLINRVLIVAMATLFPSLGNSQVLFEPNYSLKTPETINLVSFEIKQNSTVVNMSIINLVEGGYFCADKNTFITTDRGVRYKLEDAIGIPSCPEVYRFTGIGEKLYFTLVFPAIDPKTPWFDIVEECGNMCFSILGITANPGLNARVNECFNTLEAGKSEEAAVMFEALLPELEKTNHGLTGSIYLNLITIYKSLGDKKEEYYLNKLLNSSIPHKEKLIEGLGNSD